MTDTYITCTDAARLLGVSSRMVMNYIQRGKLKGAFKLGMVWAIPIRAVEELREARPEGGFKRGRKKRIDES